MPVLLEGAVLSWGKTLPASKFPHLKPFLPPAAATGSGSRSSGALVMPPGTSQGTDCNRCQTWELGSQGKVNMEAM